MGRSLAAFGIASATIAVGWLGLESGTTHGRQAAQLILLALIPTLSVLLGRSRRLTWLLAGAATFFAFTLAFDRPVWEARPRNSEHDFFGPILGDIGQGFRDSSDVPAPFDPSTYAGMHGLVMIAIFGFAAAAGIAIAARRTAAALAIVLLGAGIPLTMQSPQLASGRALALGGFVLAAALLVLVLMRRGEHGLGYAMGITAVLVAVAVGGSTSDAVAKGGFVNWDSWDWYDKPAEPVDVSYVWNGSYDGVDFPNKKTTVLEVTVPGKKRQLYWRATTLDDYTGTIWREDEGFRQGFPSGDQVNVAVDTTNVPEEILGQQLVRQNVTVKALKDRHLVGSAQALRWSINRDTTLAVNDAVSVTTPLKRGDRYSVWSYISDATPKELAKAGTSYPNGIQETYLVPSANIPALPAFGSPLLAARLDELFVAGGQLADHRPLLAAAERVTRGATSPYAVALSLERWFRTSGGFRYTEHPGSSGTTPALVEFMKTKAGYCQHFAGAMALMLRYLGIPARVAAGFTSGSYDAHAHKWTVTDHNAHTWVEVYFPHYGWLQFDPTPDRGELSEPYSYASSAFDAAEAAALGGPLGAIKGQLDRGGGLAGREGAAATGGPVGAVAGKSRGIVSVVFLLALAAGVAIVLLKEARRRARFLARDPRRLATAYRRDLVGYLVDQGHEVPQSATPDELAELTQSVFGVSGNQFARALAEARYGRPEEAPVQAKRTRRELGRLRRNLRSRLSTMQRIRGAFRLRSLTV